MAKKKPAPTGPKRRALPYVQVAAFCENVLEEKDGVMSAIRVIDRMTLIGPPIPQEGHVPALQTKALISLKSGDVKGPRSVKLVFSSPSKKKQEILDTQALFEGNEHGVQFRVDLTFTLEGEGLYWCDVLVEDKLLTRMPLRVVYPKPSLDTAAPQEPALGASAPDTLALDAPAPDASAKRPSRSGPGTPSG